MNSPQSSSLVAQRSAAAAFVLGGAALILWAVQQGTTMAAAATAVVAVMFLLVLKPDAGTLLFLALAYANAPVLLGARFGGPQVTGLVILPLIGFPILGHWMKRRGIVLDYPFLLMLLLLCSMLLSTLMAKDSRIALDSVAGYLTEGIVIYFLMLNAVRSLSTLRAAIWTLVLVGTFLSSLGIYQEMSGSYRCQFGGLAQRNTEQLEDAPASRDRESVQVENRAGGPLGGPNRFAQILLMILPLAFFRVRDERTAPGKLLAAACMLTLLGGIFVTYSRGGFLTLALLIVLLAALRYIRLLHVLLGVLAVAALITLVAPGYVARMATFSAVPQLLSDRDVVRGNGAIRGRLTEMLAAAHVFLDYPVLGVGPGQYTPFYSMQYMDNPDIAFKSMDKNRRAHCLYAELAAETGIVGLVIFLGIVVTISGRLRRLRRRLWRDEPELADLATGFWLGILGYMGAAVFLQLAYQRYLWLLLGLAGAAVQLLQVRVHEIEEQYRTEGRLLQPSRSIHP